MNRLTNWALVATACVVVYLLGEGLFAISHWDRSHYSLTYQVVELADGTGESLPSRFTRPVLSDPSEIEELLDDMWAHSIGVGNSPYEELRTRTASINEGANDCLRTQTNLRGTLTYLRSTLFEAFNPVVLFYERDLLMPDRLQRFVDRYAVRLVNLSSDEWGQRLTFPEIDASNKILIAGDSVAMGVGVNDEETLASVLQRRDPRHRYINLGIGGAEAAEIRCALERAMERYPHQARELIYVYCENDFDDDESMGTPEAVLTWLRQFVREQGIDRTTIVFAPYIFNVVPELTRFPGSREHFDDNAEEKARLLALVADAGFDWIDFGEIALAEGDERGTAFGALALYLDVVHHSPLGIELLADAIERNRST